MDIAGAIELGRALVANLSQVLLGVPEPLTAAAIAALSGGHLLIEDVPGVGKTMLARGLGHLPRGGAVPGARVIPTFFPPTSPACRCSPQTPAHGSSDPGRCSLTWCSSTSSTAPRRAPKSALLETMEEHQVTVDGDSWPLPRPHLVIATQNHMSQLGTYPLVESQLDRFAIATAIGYPDADTETRLVTHQGGRFALDDLGPGVHHRNLDGGASAPPRP